METRRSPRIAGFFLRHYVELLTAFAALFVVQFGTVPFDFTPFGEGESRPFLNVWTFVYADAVSNLFLFVPLGVFLQWCLLKRGMGRASAMLLTLFFSALLSGGIEWIQMYSPSRVSSLADLVCNVLGAGVGASVSSVGRLFVPPFIGAAIFEFHDRPLAAIAKSYCALLIVCATIPFSFSFDSSRLKSAVRNSVFVPFGESAALQSLQDQAEAEGDAIAIDLVRLQALRRWLRWAAETASFVVLAWLVVALLRCDYGFGSRAATALGMWLCGLFAVALSVLQFPVVSRGSDATDVLFRFLGTCGGILTHSFYIRPFGAIADSNMSRRWRRMAGIACVATFCHILFSGVIPLTFTLPQGGVWETVATRATLPFIAYFATRFDVMMIDVMEKFVAYAVLAALLATCWTRTSRLDFGPRLVRIALVCVGLSFLIECLQLFIPVRVVSLTDPILAAAGCVVGVIVQERAVRFYRYSSASEALGPDDRPPTPKQMRGLTLTDALVGSLTDPDSSAPAEPSPTQTQRPV